MAACCAPPRATRWRRRGTSAIRRCAGARRGCLEFNERVQYSSVVNRPRLAPSDDMRLIAWPIVVLETWDIARAMPRQIVPPPAARPVPDYFNWSWHEYEMRVAFWRLKAMLDRRG